MAQPTTQHNWDESSVRRAMRLLGAHSPRIHDAQATAQTIRLIWDIVQRRGIRADIFQIPGVMPMAVIGDGPTLLITYIDDDHPETIASEALAVSVAGDVATGAGVTRKGGMLAVLGALLSGKVDQDDITLVIESDRHSGSRALEAWLDTSRREYHTALWEATDLPIPIPALFRAAAGQVTIRITVRADIGNVENHFAGVLPDAGQLLVDVLSDLKSRDAEVLVPGFYEDVEAPDAESLELMQAVAPVMHAWATRGSTHTQLALSAEHLTLGTFCAPSVFIRSINLQDAWPLMARGASAVIEARLIPSQNARALVRSITEFVHARVPSAEVETLIVRQPAPTSSINIEDLINDVLVYPVAPGASPAGLLDALGIPTLGFATVSRSVDATEDEMSISAVIEASRFVAYACNHVTAWKRVAR